MNNKMNDSVWQKEKSETKGEGNETDKINCRKYRRETESPKRSSASLKREKFREDSGGRSTHGGDEAKAGREKRRVETTKVGKDVEESETGNTRRKRKERFTRE